MSFKLRIPGRDDMQAVPAANPANPLIEVVISASVPAPAGDTPAPSVEAISRLAGLAAPEVCVLDDEARRERSAIISANGTPYWEADKLAGLLPWTETEITSFSTRQARITWLGYGSAAERLAEMLVHRDRDMDDRRLCVECQHAGSGRRCARREAFVLDQLQRCPAFKEITT